MTKIFKHFKPDSVGKLLFHYLKPRNSSIETRVFQTLIAFLANVGYVTILFSLLFKLVSAEIVLEQLSRGVTFASDLFIADGYQMYSGSITDLQNFMAWILAPTWEEFVFRYVPFYFLMKDKSEEYLKRNLVPLVLFFSVIFGLLHGGPINILIQGVGGLILWFVFLQSGKYRYWWSVGAHALWNFSVSIGLFWLSGN